MIDMFFYYKNIPKNINHYLHYKIIFILLFISYLIIIFAKINTIKRMKKIILSLTVALLSFGSAFAMPEFKGLSNKNGKTVIKVEIPASQRDKDNGLSIDQVKLYNNGDMLFAKRVDAIWGENSTIILEFKKLTVFEDCTLFFLLNGELISIDIQSLINL